MHESSLCGEILTPFLETQSGPNQQGASAVSHHDDFQFYMNGSETYDLSSICGAFTLGGRTLEHFCSLLRPVLF